MEFDSDLTMDESEKLDEQLMTMSHEDVKELFHLCDANNSGYIEKAELGTIIPNADCATLERLLKELDCDGDGKISLQELENGLHKFTGAVAVTTSTSDYSSCSEEILSPHDSGMDERVKLEDTYSLSADDEHYDGHRKNSTLDLFGTLNSHYEAYLVYQHLAQQDSQMLDKFEVFLREAVQKIKEQSNANEELEHAFNLEQKKQQERLDALEEEAELMTKKIEQKTTQKLESKHEEDRLRYEEEISSLHENLEQMKQLQSDMRQQAKSELRSAKERLHQMEEELTRISKEKREAETNALMASSQLATYKQTMRQHSVDQHKEDWVLDYMTEQENLVKQVEHLQDMNKQLHDVNKDLNGELLTLRTSTAMFEPRKPKVSLRYELESDSAHQIFCTGPDEVSALEEECSNPPTVANVVGQQESQFSGVSLFEELEKATITSSRINSATVDTCKLETAEATSPEVKTDIIDGEETTHNLADPSDDRKQVLRKSGVVNIKKLEVTPDSGSISNDHSSSAKNSKSKKLKKQSRTSRNGNSGSIQTLPAQISFVDITPERMYKVIFAGDSGVGKTSFILHLCKGVFHSTVSSTLGIDFYTKNVEVDESRISLQLWDTAGQERFRCISTSYFRKTDGVILLYDCCSERSFMNVREWVGTIRQASETEQLPIMICANKIDTREEKKELGYKVVTTSMGEELATQCKTMFCELSAKTGEKMQSCVDKLARIMKEREDEGIERYDTGLQIAMASSVKEKTRDKCC